MYSRGSPLREDAYAYQSFKTAGFFDGELNRWTGVQENDPYAGTQGQWSAPSTSMWSYLPGEIGNTVFGMGKEIGYRAADFLNDLTYDASFYVPYLLTSGNYTGGGWSFYKGSLSQMGQLLDRGQTTWARATFSSVPVVGSGYNFVTGEDLLSGQSLTGMNRAAAGFGLLADVSFISAGGMRWAGVDYDIGAVAQRVGIYSRGAWDGLGVPRGSLRMASLFGAAEDAFEDLARANRYGKMAIQQALEEGTLREVTLRQAGVTGVTARSMAARSQFLRSLADDYRCPSWMKPWLEEGRVPPGYEVDHIKPLSIGGSDTPSNMRLQGVDLHDIHHTFYRPWE